MNQRLWINLISSDDQLNFVVTSLLMNITIYFSQRVNLQNHQADGLNNVFQLCVFVFCFFYLI